MDSLEFCLTLLDSLMAYFIFFPMVCFYWRGSWDLIGYYVLPGKEPLSYWVHAGIGACTAINYLWIPLLDKHVDKENKVSITSYYLWRETVNMHIISLKLLTISLISITNTITCFLNNILV